MPNVMAAQPNIGGALCESSVIQSWTRIGCIHGLDWIGLGSIGLGRMFEKLGWIGLDWIAANG